MAPGIDLEKATPAGKEFVNTLGDIFIDPARLYPVKECSDRGQVRSAWQGVQEGGRCAVASCMTYVRPGSARGAAELEKPLHESTHQVAASADCLSSSSGQIRLLLHSPARPTTNSKNDPTTTTPSRGGSERAMAF
jgi:hypothetical protein